MSETNTPLADAMKASIANIDTELGKLSDLAAQVAALEAGGGTPEPGPDPTKPSPDYTWIDQTMQELYFARLPGDTADGLRTVTLADTPGKSFQIAIDGAIDQITHNADGAGALGGNIWQRANGVWYSASVAGQWTQQAGNPGFPVGGTVPPVVTGAFHTQGASIIDDKGKPFRFVTVGWWDWSSNPKRLTGLNAMSYRDNLQAMKALGFNGVRIHTNEQEILSGGIGLDTGYISLGHNPDLNGKNSLQMYDLVLDAAAELGMHAIVDCHGTMAGISSGFTSNGQGGWIGDGYDTNSLVQAWGQLSQRWKGKPALVGMDILNEPWASVGWNDYKGLYQLVGNAVDKRFLVLCAGPFVPGTIGGDLSQWKTNPVVLNEPNRAVGVVHPYPAPWSPSAPDQQWWATCTANWAYLVAEDIVPVYCTECMTACNMPDGPAYARRFVKLANGQTGVPGQPTKVTQVSPWCWDDAGTESGWEVSSALITQFSNPTQLVQSIQQAIHDLMAVPAT
jgi:aryl-phospho-beta-D-glucosidase BglC (GH1 family)